MTRPPLLDPRRRSIVHFDRGPSRGVGGAPGAATVDDDILVSQVQRAVDEWVPAICSLLQCRPPGAIVVTLRQGTWVARTKGAHVLLPVAPGADAASALGAVKAALAHELVHAVAGRVGNHALNEGLAVHVDATLRLAGPAWPFFDLSPHRWVAILGEERKLAPLADLLSGRAVPRSDAPAEVMSVHWARYYLQAGSFVGFLIGQLGPERFLASGPGGPALPEGEALVALEKAWLEAVGGPPTEAEWRRRDESVQVQVDKYREPGGPARFVRPGGPPR